MTTEAVSGQARLLLYWNFLFKSMYKLPVILTIVICISTGVGRHVKKSVHQESLKFGVCLPEKHLLSMSSSLCKSVFKNFFFRTGTSKNVTEDLTFLRAFIIGVTSQEEKEFGCFMGGFQSPIPLNTVNKSLKRTHTHTHTHSHTHMPLIKHSSSQPKFEIYKYPFLCFYAGLLTQLVKVEYDICFVNHSSFFTIIGNSESNLNCL